MSSTDAIEIHYGVLLWRALRRWRWLVLLVFLGVAGPILAFAFMMEPRYESAGTIWVEEPPIPVFQDVGPRGRLPVLLTILASRNLATSVVDVLPRRAYEELLRHRRHRDLFASLHNRIRRFLGGSVAPVSPREEVISELLAARMTFTPRAQTGIVTVKAMASDPIVAADIATAYVETVQSKTRFFTREESRAVREFLETQAKQLGESLRQAEEALVQYERERGAVRIDDRVAQSVNSLHQAETNLAGVALSEDIARTRLAAVKGQLEGKPAERKVTGTFAVSFPLKDLVERWQKAEASLASLSRRYTEAHPQVRAAREEAQQLWSRLDGNLRQSLGIVASTALAPPERAALIDQALALAQEVGRLQIQREGHEAQARALRAGLGNLSKDQYEFAKRKQVVETNKNLHDLLSRKAEEASIRFQEELRNVKVLDPPSVPTSPSGRQTMKVVLLGLALGLVAAIGLPIGMEMLDSTIKSEEEAEAILGWPVLGSILAMEPPRAALTNGARPSRALRAGGARRSA